MELKDLTRNELVRLSGSVVDLMRTSFSHSTESVQKANETKTIKNLLRDAFEATDLEDHQKLFKRMWAKAKGEPTLELVLFHGMCVLREQNVNTFGKDNWELVDFSLKRLFPPRLIDAGLYSEFRAAHDQYIKRQKELRWV